MLKLRHQDTGVDRVARVGGLVYVQNLAYRVVEVQELSLKEVRVALKSVEFKWFRDGDGTMKEYEVKSQCRGLVSAVFRCKDFEVPPDWGVQRSLLGRLWWSVGQWLSARIRYTPDTITTGERRVNTFLPFFFTVPAGLTGR